jgi:hypothetical protein
MIGRQLVGRRLSPNFNIGEQIVTSVLDDSVDINQANDAAFKAKSKR